MLQTPCMMTIRRRKCRWGRVFLVVICARGTKVCTHSMRYRSRCIPAKVTIILRGPRMSFCRVWLSHDQSRKLGEAYMIQLISLTRRCIRVLVASYCLHLYLIQKKQWPFLVAKLRLHKEAKKGVKHKL